jgi:hypothetical protein
MMPNKDNLGREAFRHLAGYAIIGGLFGVVVALLIIYLIYT